MNINFGKIVLAAGCLALGIGTADAATQLKANSANAAKHPVIVAGYLPFIKAIEDGSKGDIKIQLFVGGQLLSFTATLGGLRDGIIDMGNTVPSYHPAELRDAQLVADISILGNSGPVMAAAVTEYSLLYCTDCVQQLRAQGVVDLGYSATQPYRIVTKKPVNSVEDLKGMKIRSATALWNRFLTNFGAVPLSLPADDIYTALSQGLADGTLSFGSTVRTYSFWDSAKYITMTSLGTFQFSPYAFSQKTWQKLTPAQRRLFLDAAGPSLVGPSVADGEVEASMLSESKGKGVTIIQQSPAMKAAITAWMNEDFKGIAAAREKEGVKNAAAKIEKFREIHDKWVRLVTPIETDAAKIGALMKKEIFDKIDAGTYGM